jgi:hypothetical protein
MVGFVEQIAICYPTICARSNRNKQLGQNVYVRGYGRTKMKKLVLSIALSALVSVAICGTTQAAYYHHRHHHYWHHGGHPVAAYWNYYRTDWPGRGNNEASTR